MKEKISLLAFAMAVLISCNSTEPVKDSVEGDTTDIKQNTGAKFEPENGKVLVFIGQDNNSVGGNDATKANPSGSQVWDNGYIDNFKDSIGIPAGITHYVYMCENKTNAFNRKFAEGIIEGLNVVSDWAAGDMCMRCYLDNASNQLQNTVIHLSISMEFDAEDDIAAGKSDDLIAELGDFLTEFSNYPFLIRIGYEFDGSWNAYDSVNYKKAFIRIVDKLRERKIDNFATVMASINMFTKKEVWESYYPGDDYVDWVGYSFFDVAHDKNAPALEFARAHKKPVFIAESTPWKGTMMAKDDGAKVWDEWFKALFDHIEANPDVVKAISYINAEWHTQEMWAKSDVFEIDSRMQLNEEVKSRWIAKMREPRYIHQTEGTYELIGFEKK